MIKSILAALAVALLTTPALAGWKPTAVQREVLAKSRADTEYFLNFIVALAGFDCDGTTGYRRLGLTHDTGALLYLINCPGETFAVLIHRDGEQSPTAVPCRRMKSQLNVACEQLSPAMFQQP